MVQRDGWPWEWNGGAWEARREAVVGCACFLERGGRGCVEWPIDSGAHLSGLWEGVGKQPCVVRGRAAARLAAWRERHEGARSSARPRSRGGESECAGLRRRRGCCRRDRRRDRRRHGVLDLRLDQLIVLLLLTHEIAPIIAHPIGPISTATPISRPGAPLLRLAPHRPSGGAARGRDPDGGTLSARLGQQRRRRLAASSNGEQHRRCEHVGRNLELAFLGRGVKLRDAEEVRGPTFPGPSDIVDTNAMQRAFV